MGELPSSYCYGEKVDLPDVVKPGYQFLGWKIFSFGVFSQYYHLTSFPKYCNQDIDFVAMFVKLDLLNLSDGELKVSVDDDKLQTKNLKNMTIKMIWKLDISLKYQKMRICQKPKLFGCQKIKLRNYMRILLKT